MVGKEGWKEGVRERGVQGEKRVERDDEPPGGEEAMTVCMHLNERHT